jgi:nicotinamide mononucleotide transporter
MLEPNYWFQLIELMAAILGFVYVYLIATNKSSGWIFGIASATLYAYFFNHNYTWGLFSQQIAYIILGVYGLFTWSAKAQSLPIGSLGKKLWLWIGITLMAGFLFYVCIQWLNRSSSRWEFSIDPIADWRAVLDAQFFVFSLLATWLTTRKKLENWHIWIVVNIIGTIWFAYEQWWSTSALYFAYLLLAINGLKKWSKALYA